jgi:uncharacterized membrane protein YcaP (DUF421 family)
MKPEDIKITDWGRIFIGNVPPVFFVEIAIRMIFIYLLLMIAMRLMGKRMASQFTRNEFAALVSLSAAIGVATLSPDNGLLPAGVAAAVVVGVSKGLQRISVRDMSGSKEIARGSIETLVYDGVLNTGALAVVQITRERVLAQMRTEGVEQLGEVKRLYIESNGKFSLLRMPRPKPGLFIVPDDDSDLIRSVEVEMSSMVCKNCGADRPRGNDRCVNCSSDQWVHPVWVPPGR